MDQVLLSEACDAKSGNSTLIKGRLSAVNDGSLYPAFSATGQDVYAATYDHEGEAVIISAVGARCGKCFLASGKWSAIANTHILFPKPEKTNVRFLWYLVNDESFWIKGGTAQPFVKVLDSLKKKIPLPPLHEQQRIVSLLDEADELRRLREQADRRTADLIPAVFYEMFGDPAGRYQVRPLSMVAHEFRYGTSNKSSDVGYPALRIPNVVGNTLDLSDLKFVQVLADELSRIKLQSGDVLFVRTNGNPDYIGRSAIFETEVARASGLDPDLFIYASYLIRARLDLSQVDPYFVQHYLCTPAGRKEVRKRARTSAGQYNMNTEGLSTIPIPLPPLSLQTQFAAGVAKIRALQTRQAESRRRLDDLFESMLHRAFQGEL